MKAKELLSKLDKSKNEREVESLWYKFLGFSGSVKYIKNSDGVIKDKLFEFKFESEFWRKEGWTNSAYKALAQSIYYLKRISDMGVKGQERLPYINIIISKSGAFYVPTQILERIVGDTEEGLNVDWLRAPSSPDPILVRWLKENDFFERFSIKFYSFMSEDIVGDFKETISGANPVPAKIEINENNFVHIFELWKKLFWDTEDDPRQVADNYVLDINLKFDFIENQNTLINVETGRTWEVSREKYKMFWSFYKRPPSVRVQHYILSHKDCLYDEDLRNDTGDFYTPLSVASLGRKYINDQLYLADQVRSLWWDPAAGGANLFIQSPDKEKIILSTLENADFRTLKSFPQFSDSTIEKFNFLKEKIPESIKEKLETNDQLVFLLNPPFNDQTGHSKGQKENPNSVGKEFIQMQHSSEISLRSIRSTYSKFLYQINNVFEEFEIGGYVAIFSKSSWLTGVDSRDFTEFWYRRFIYRGGFIVPSKLFRGTKGQWPVLFSIWERRASVDFDSKPQEIEVDVFNDKLEKIGLKKYSPPGPETVRLQDTLDKDCLKTKSKVKTVPMKNEYKVYSGKPYCDFLHEGGLGYLYCFANDVQHSGSKLILMSAPYGGSNANGLTVVKENFESCLSVYGIRKSVKSNWINDKDEFLLTDKILKSSDYRKLVRMSALWSILEGGYTSSLKGVVYQGERHNIKNNFFAIGLDELKKLDVPMSRLPSESSYASYWVDEKQEDFTLLEKNAISAYEKFIIDTFKSGCRKKGDKERQVLNLDCSPRQLINGVINYVDRVDEDVKLSYENYLKATSSLQNKIFEMVEKLEIVPEKQIFSEGDQERKLDATDLKKGPKLLTEKEMRGVAEERLELAAYLMNKLQDDPNLGRTKLAKVFFIADTKVESDLRTNYKREAAGPLDPNLVYGDKFGYEKMGEKLGIFAIKRNKHSVKYLPKDDFGRFVKNSSGSWKANKKEVDKVVKIFRPLNTRQAEIAATLYACWNDLLFTSRDITDAQVLDEFFNKWHDKKKRFQRSKVEKALGWLRKKRLTPKGERILTR